MANPFYPTRLGYSVTHRVSGAGGGLAGCQLSSPRVISSNGAPQLRLTCLSSTVVPEEIVSTPSNTKEPDYTGGRKRISPPGINTTGGQSGSPRVCSLLSARSRAVLAIADCFLAARCRLVAEHVFPC